MKTVTPDVVQELESFGKYVRQSGLPSLADRDLDACGALSRSDGRPPFDAADGFASLLDAKRTLADRLPELLPDDVARNDLLVGLCRRLVAYDPARRFPSADAVDLGKKGAAAFHRQLVMGNLASEYEHDLREWLGALG